ncbi:unnamed protein product [Protopolystoma xenopodis]|uniref:Uncharacterized protein n=1 Tax=Protopolystoma xenopodis TaxID=117903 RepID=A0A448WGC9_9PLAT|nr:unnamed protein product [Protopolystoma xenopodis]
MANSLTMPTTMPEFGNVPRPRFNYGNDNSDNGPRTSLNFVVTTISCSDDVRDIADEILAPFYLNRSRLPRKQRQHESPSKANRQLIVMQSLVVNYDSSSSEEDKSESPHHPSSLLNSSVFSSVNAAPPVEHKLSFLILFAQLGPVNPFKSIKQLAPKNTLTGYVEEAHVNEFSFENQHRTFVSYGYARDPTAECGTQNLVGDVDKVSETDGKTVFEKSKKRKGDLRKRDCKWDPTKEDFTGPWGKYVGEETVSMPSEEDRVYLEAYLAKRATRKRRVEEAPVEEKSTLHIKSPVDYQGRSFLHPPHDVVGVKFFSQEPPERCFLPKKLMHEWVNAHTNGVAAFKLFPQTGHILLSAGMDGKVKVYNLLDSIHLLSYYLNPVSATSVTLRLFGKHSTLDFVDTVLGCLSFMLSYLWLCICKPYFIFLSAYVLSYSL